MALTVAEVINDPAKLENERQYLSGLVAQGGGVAEWAKEQAKVYGITDLNKSITDTAKTVNDAVQKAGEIVFGGITYPVSDYAPGGNPNQGTITNLEPLESLAFKLGSLIENIQNPKPGSTLAESVTAPEWFGSLNIDISKYVKYGFIGIVVILGLGIIVNIFKR